MSCTPRIRSLRNWRWGINPEQRQTDSKSDKTELTPLFLMESLTCKITLIHCTCSAWRGHFPPRYSHATVSCPAHKRVAVETNLNWNLMNLANSLFERLIMFFSFISSFFFFFLRARSTRWPIPVSLLGTNQPLPYDICHEELIQLGQDVKTSYYSWQ